LDCIEFQPIYLCWLSVLGSFTVLRRVLVTALCERALINPVTEINDVRV